MRTALIAMLAIILSTAAAASPQNAEALADRVTSVTQSIDSLATREREALDALTAEDIDHLLKSDDPHHRGVGIFLVDSRCLPEMLGPNAHLFDDERATVDTAFPDAFNQIHHHPSTVAQRYKEAWSTWYGAPVRSSEVIRQQQANGELNPWSTYRAWSSLIRRSGGFSDERVAQMKGDIAALPDDLRWLVAVGAWTSQEGKDVFTENEICELVLSVDEQTQRAILNGSPPLPPDFVARWGEGKSILHDRARAILKGEPIPEPELPEELKQLRERTGVQDR